MKVPLIDLAGQYVSIQSEVEPAVLDLLRRQQFVLGEAVDRFEKHIAHHGHCPHAIGVSSGTDALLCAMMALNIGPGDEVIVPTFTFFASAGSIARLGAKPVFVDIDPVTFNIDPEKIKQAITPKTKGIMPVHLYGQMAPMAPIMDLARRHHLHVIEDACQSIGSLQHGKMPGELGTVACLSFYPTKNLAGPGDSGLILCQDADLAQRCRLLRVHGQEQIYYHRLVGGNFRIDALQAVVLDIKLKYLDGWAAQRQSHAALYDQLLKPPVQTPIIAPGNVSVYNQYVIRAPRRDELQPFLKQKDIGTGVYYPVPLHLQKCFAYLGGKPGDCPVAEKACQDVLALPVYPELTDEQITYVAQSINQFYLG